MDNLNPLYPIQVEGWRGVIRHQELASFESSVEDLVESAYAGIVWPTYNGGSHGLESPTLAIPEPRRPFRHFDD